MGIVKPLLLTAMFIVACGHAVAQQENTPPPPRAAHAKAVPAPDPKKLHKRRAVQQQVYTMPPSAAPVEAYRPILSPPALPTVPRPPGPVILNGCLNGVCSDPAGSQLNGGVGTTLLDGKGRTCVQGPVTAQCF